MADDELSALRAKRLAELQGQYGNPGEMQQQQQKRDAMERDSEMRNSFLAQILDQNARARLNSIALVKPDKAKIVENMLIQMAQSGQIPGKVGEAQLVSLLEQVSKQTQKKTTVTFKRKHYGDSDDEDY